MDGAGGEMADPSFGQRLRRRKRSGRKRAFLQSYRNKRVQDSAHPQMLSVLPGGMDAVEQQHRPQAASGVNEDVRAGEAVVAEARLREEPAGAAMPPARQLEAQPAILLQPRRMILYGYISNTARKIRFSV